MARTHYVLWGNACEILSNVMFQALTLDITPKEGTRKAVSHKHDHFQYFSRSTEPPEIIRRHHRNLPSRAVQIGRIRKGNHCRRFKEIVAEVERKKPTKCKEKHLYWISQIITKCCTNMGRNGKPDPIIEWPKSSALLEEYLFLRKTFPDAAEFPYRKMGPEQSSNMVKIARSGKNFVKKAAIKLAKYTPEDDKNEQKGPFDHDENIIQPEPMTLQNEVSRKENAAAEAAKKAAEEAEKKLERLLHRNQYKTKRDDKKHRIKDENPENPFAPERKEDEESIVTDSDFAGNYRERNEADNDPTPEKKPRVHHRHREYVRDGHGSLASYHSDSDSDLSISSMYAPSVRRIYDKRSGHHGKYRSHGREHHYRPVHYDSDVSSDTGRPSSVYSYPPPHHGGFRYGY
ncbi:hypothetical protein BPAE_0006g01000 [Botrytis paeoniae]|uniref:Uncharacterized protein n=1 Tax=Botrytis paeoniae TaxID=278948 RepID=A0A4Z1G4C4_9HELO|nr:hypothetical protein BPAE_0006g01000 [Botrytis paeoniae]